MEKLIEYLIRCIQNREKTPEALIAELDALRRILSVFEYDFEKKKVIDALIGEEAEEC